MTTAPQNGEKLVKYSMSGLNLLDQFNAPTAKVKSGDIAGWRQLWSHLMSSPRDTRTKLDMLIKNGNRTFSILNKFKEGDACMI